MTNSSVGQIGPLVAYPFPGGNHYLPPRGNQVPPLNRGLTMPASRPPSSVPTGSGPFPGVAPAKPFPGVPRSQPWRGAALSGPKPAVRAAHAVAAHKAHPVHSAATRSWAGGATRK